MPMVMIAMTMIMVAMAVVMMLVPVIMGVVIMPVIMSMVMPMIMGAMAMVMIAMAVIVVMVMIMPALIGLRLQPALHVQRLGGRIVQARIEQQDGQALIFLRVHMHGTGIQVMQAAAQGLHRGRFGQIGLGQDHAVGDGGLLQALFMLVQLAHAMDAVNGSHDPIQAEARRDQRIGHQRVQDGGWIGQTRRLDHHAVEFGDLAPHALHVQVAQRLG